MAVKQIAVRVKRWQGGQHPTLSNITRLVKQEGLRPYVWENNANHRHAVRTHGYHKILYVIEGTLNVVLPDSNQQVRLRGGDRMDIPAGVRHGIIAGSSGVRCMEAALRQREN